MITSCSMKLFQFYLLCQDQPFFKCMTELIGQSNSRLSALCCTSNYENLKELNRLNQIVEKNINRTLNAIALCL